MDFKRLTEYLDFVHENIGVPGLDIAIYKGYDEVYRRVVGWADREEKTPLKEGFLFNAYSCTKIITCIAALRLIEEGKLSLTDKLSDYIPEFSAMQVRATEMSTGPVLVPASTPVLIWHLFTMTGGFNYEVTPHIEKVIGEAKGNPSTLSVIKAIAKEPLYFQPGSRWLYSFGHDILACVVEVISKMRFRDYVEKYIFTPLEMKDSTFERTPEIEKRMMQQYIMEEDLSLRPIGRLSCSYVFGKEYDCGGAGLISSVEDFSKFLCALANNGVSKQGYKLISQNSINLMREDFLNEVQHQDYYNGVRNYKGSGYGLGVRTTKDGTLSKNLAPKGEFGWNGAAGCFASVYPEENISIFYAQHVLDCTYKFKITQKLSNIIYSCLS